MPKEKTVGINQNPIQKIINKAKYKLWYPFYMSYLNIRNYKKEISHNERRYGSRWTYWELRDPLKLKYQTSSWGYNCKECKARDRDETDHLEYRRNFERYLWSQKINYINTNCTCDDLLFAPLEESYGNGGEESLDPTAGADSQWTIVEKVRGY